MSAGLHGRDPALRLGREPIRRPGPRGLPGGPADLGVAPAAGRLQHDLGDALLGEPVGKAEVDFDAYLRLLEVGGDG